MKNYILSRLAELAVVMALISFFSFAIIYLAPGDISAMYITEEMTQEEKDAVLESLGLDKSMPEQYFAWAKKALHGDFGISLANKSAVAPQIMKRLPVTVLLMGTSLLLALVLAVPLGLLAGQKKGSWADHAVNGIAYLGMSVPAFCLGILLIIVFALKLKLLPTSGMHTVGKNSPFDTFLHLIMPAVTLSLGNFSVFVRYIRANTISQLKEEYVLTAKAKGTPMRKIMRRHVLKNTLLPIITLVGMRISSLVCGSFIIESVFGWPGVGTLAMSAIGVRDYPVIMAYVMMSGFLLVIGNFTADLLYAAADPRVKKEVASVNGK